MVGYEYKDLFLQNSVEKQITITYGSTTITNEDLFNQTMTLEESLCSDQQLTFGSCEASVLKFQVANIVAPVKNQWVTVRMALDGNTDDPFSLGKYKVESDKPTADRKWREVVAYDAMYDVINSDVIGWYNSVLPDAGSLMTVKQFRTSFLEHFGIEEEEVSLVNDEVVIKRTVNAEELSGATVIKAICEINGCFGHIGRDGVFRYIHLVQGMQGLYPNNDIYPSDDLYPHDPKTTPIPKNIYISCTYEDFTTDEIGQLQMVNGSTGVVSSVGSGANCYTIESNFLLSDKTEEELDKIGERILEKIRGVSYRPFDAECLGNPCFEVGDPVRLSTTYEIVESYILKRTLTGIQALRDSYSSDGVEKYEIQVNSTDRAVGQLIDRADSLESDVETINGDIDGINEDIDDINSDIEEINENVGAIHISLQKTEEGLEAEVSRATAAEGNLSSLISITADEIKLEASRNYETKTDSTTKYTDLSSRIQLTADNITSTVSATYQTKSDAISSYNTLTSQITQTASSITSSVSATYETKSNASSAYSTLSTEITQTADSIVRKVVAKGEVVSEINQTSDTITLRSNRLIVDSTYFTLDAYGKINASGGKIGNFTISGGTLIGNPTTIADSFISTRYITARELNAESGYALQINGDSRVRISAGSSMGVAFDSNASGKYHFRPGSSGDIDCGSASYHWNNVYADTGTIQTSDRNEKADIMDMPDLYAEQMVEGALPKTYRMINGDSGRTHNGLIAQDVEQQLYRMGLTTKDFAGLAVYEKETEDGARTGKLGYGLRYEEYIPILIKYAQIQNRRIWIMKNEIFSLQGEMSLLKQRLGGS